jgi:hypothetical protein
VFDSYSYNAITSRNDQVNSVATFSIEARENITITFNCEFSQSDIGTLTIDATNAKLIVLSESTAEVSITLKTGQKANFEFERNDVENDGCFIRIEQIVIS